MKYAILGPRGAINRVTETEPQNVMEDSTVVQITDEQAQTVADGRTAKPPVIYFLENGNLITMEQKRLASMTPAQKIQAGQQHVQKAGFGADEKIILWNKLYKAEKAGALASVPKLIALYGWMEEIQGKAIAGQTDFTPPPYTYQEVIAE